MSLLHDPLFAGFSSFLPGFFPTPPSHLSLGSRIPSSRPSRHPPITTDYVRKISSIRMARVDRRWGKAELRFWLKHLDNVPYVVVYALGAISKDSFTGKKQGGTGVFFGCGNLLNSACIYEENRIEQEVADIIAAILALRVLRWNSTYRTALLHVNSWDIIDACCYYRAKLEAGERKDKNIDLLVTLFHETDKFKEVCFVHVDEESGGRGYRKAKQLAELAVEEGEKNYERKKKKAQCSNPKNADDDAEKENKEPAGLADGGEEKLDQVTIDPSESVEFEKKVVGETTALKGEEKAAGIGSASLKKDVADGLEVEKRVSDWLNCVAEKMSCAWH